MKHVTFNSKGVNDTGIQVPESLTLGTFGLVPRLSYSTYAGFYTNCGKPQIDMLKFEEDGISCVYIL